jgi:hypothetical protein
VGPCFLSWAIWAQHSVCVGAVGAYVSSHISYSRLAYAGWLCYRSVAHTGLLDYQGLWVAGTHPTLVGQSSGPMRWAKPWDSLAVRSHVCLGPTLYDVSLRVMASWPAQREQTDLAREVTVGVTTYGPVSWVRLEVLITFGSVFGLGPGCSSGAASSGPKGRWALGVGYGSQPIRTSVDGG